MLKKHTLKEFDNVVDRLVDTITAMGDAVAGQLDKTRALIPENNPALIASILEEEERINEFQEEIDRQSVLILSAYQPVAQDLRCIIAALKIGTDLERIADYAVNIAKQVKKNGPVTDGEMAPAMLEMCRLAGTMLREVIPAYRARDIAEAQRVWEMDDELDARYKALLKQVGSAPSGEGQAVAALPKIVSIAKYFERAGDHIKNIAEHILYMVTGDR